MRFLWRISNHNDLSGLGGEKSDGRWHTAARGKRIVYLSEHPALALIETIANLKGDPRLFPDTYQFMKVLWPDDVEAEAFAPGSLSPNWRDALPQTRSLGDQWLSERKTPLLAIPSSPSPESTNYLLNPLHPLAGFFRIEWSQRLQYDKRLFHLPADH